MKLMYLSIIAFMLSCSTKIVKTNSVEMTNKLQIDIILDEETNMELYMKNNIEKVLRISDPECYINSTIQIIGKEGEVQQVLKVKPDVSCANNMIVLDGGEEKQFIYPYRLSELFQLENNAEYEIILYYKGGIVTSEGKVLEGEVSARQKFVVK